MAVQTRFSAQLSTALDDQQLLMRGRVLTDAEVVSALERKRERAQERVPSLAPPAPAPALAVAQESALVRAAARPTGLATAVFITWEITAWTERGTTATHLTTSTRVRECTEIFMEKPWVMPWARERTQVRQGAQTL